MRAARPTCVGVRQKLPSPLLGPRSRGHRKNPCSARERGEADHMRATSLAARVGDLASARMAYRRRTDARPARSSACAGSRPTHARCAPRAPARRGACPRHLARADDARTRQQQRRRRVALRDCGQQVLTALDSLRTRPRSTNGRRSSACSAKPTLQRSTTSWAPRSWKPRARAARSARRRARAVVRAQNRTLKRV